VTKNGTASQFVMRDTVDGSGMRQRIFRVRTDHITNADITGDFTNWQSMPLAASNDGWWAITLPIVSGVHQMNLRLNGGSWIVPPGLASLQDEFNGAVGLIVVP
jgi:1,4-alpha-glucan branching enzyme